MGHFILGMMVAHLPALVRWYWRRERAIQEEVVYGPDRKRVARQPIQPVYPDGNPVLNRYSLRNIPGHRSVRGKRKTF